MFKRPAGRRLRSDVTPASLMEALENRQMFGVGSTPLPNITDLESPNNTVVRLQTNRGDIDFELFDSIAPGTVTNFLHYVKDGDFDQNFFHRLATGFVLQGGGFRFDNATATAFNPVPTDPAIQNEFQRSNVARTIAMAKLGGNPNSATNQWFINLANNSTNLDAQNGGFTVFGRVLGEASWTVVQQIAGLATANMTTAPEFVGAFSSNFGTVPVTGSYTPGSHVTEDILVRIHDMEIIKPVNVQAFYSTQVYYSEGFAGSTISEFLPLGNPGDTAISYQVIVRSEVPNGDIRTTTGWFRDRVINTGTIAPHSRGGITISQFGNGGAPGANDLVPQGVPYAIEVWATGNIAANLSHYDFGTSTGEAFTPTPSTTWGLSGAAKVNGSIFDFLVWDNPNKSDAHLTITFYFDTASPVTISTTTDAFRRGGYAFQNVAEIPDNTTFSVRITSDVPIVAALSHFDNRNGQSGSSSLGVPDTGLSRGVIPFTQGGPDINNAVVSFLNANATPAVVTLHLRFDDGTELVPGGATLVISGLRRKALDLAPLLNTPIQQGLPFSVYYTSNVAVYGHSSIVALGDAAANGFATSAATGYLFAEGFMDPGRAGDTVLETMSIYNPNSLAFHGSNVTANITFRFLYTDGFVLTHTLQVGGGARSDLVIDEFQGVLQQGTQNNRFFYSIQVTSDVPIIAQMFHYDLNLGGLQASGGFSTLGMPFGTITRLDQI